MEISSSRARIKLSSYLDKAAEGEDILITMNDDVVAILSKRRPKGGWTIPRIGAKSAKNQWSEVISAVSSVGCQFLFKRRSAPHDEVYLYRPAAVSNIFVDAWARANIVAQGKEPVREDIDSDKSCKELLLALIRTLRRMDSFPIPPEMIPGALYNEHDLDRIDVD